MNRLARSILEYPRTVIAAWVLLLLPAIYFSLQLQGVTRGSMDAIPGSPSERVMERIRAAFGPDAAFVLPLLVHNPRVSVQDGQFGARIARLEQAMMAGGEIVAVRHYWNHGAAHLLGADGHSALVLLTPKAASFLEAESLVEPLRTAIHRAVTGQGFSAKLTGPVAVIHDLNRHSADDLLTAERVALPLTLLILLVVFGAPLAAALPLILACCAVTMSLAALYALSAAMPVSIFARNTATMIGLAVGVDYALLLLGRFREELAAGAGIRQALEKASARTGNAVLFSGMTVTGGFLALFLVRVPLMQSLAIAGVVVVAVAVAATLTLLPALLSVLGTAVYWPFPVAGMRARNQRFPSLWHRWGQLVMRRPWPALGLALALIVFFAIPVTRMNAWNLGAKDLPLEFEARQGAAILNREFAGGWLGPVVLAVETVGEGSVWDGGRPDAIQAAARRLAGDPRVAHVGGLPEISRSGSMALVLLVPRAAPESAEAMQLVSDLRRDPWPEARAAGLAIGVAGASAGLADFDRELFGSLWRVVPAVLLASFLMLMALFRSVLIPLKAVVLNLMSVLAAWGFLVYVFQDGFGASLLGLEAPGGLNAFIVVMLFTILFGLSMDYEVFLLSRIREERDAGADNAAAVARGLQRTAGIITSAACVMVCIFGAFALTRLTATREFGLGLAFAVALDATVIRLVLLPAAMRLLGEWNWWAPRFLRRSPHG